VTGDWQEDWAERPPPPSPPRPSSRGRHSRPPQDYGDQDPYAPAEGYPQTDPYDTPAQYGEADPYGQEDPYGQPDTYPGATDPYAMPDRSPQPDPLTAPGRFAPPDPLTAPGGPGPDRSAPTDPYATRPHRIPASPEPGLPYGPLDGPATQAYDRPGYPADEPYGGPARGRHGSPAAPPGRGDQNRNGRPDRNGHARTDAYDPLTAPQSPNGYGPPGGFDPPAERGSQNGHGAVSYAQPDDGPFRWRPSPDAARPEGLAPLPDFRGAPGSEPSPAPRDWDPPRQPDWDRPQERDWDPGPDDSAIGLAEPVSGPMGPGARQRQVDERREREEPQDWDAAQQGRGLVPGLGDGGSGRDSGSGRGRGGRRRRRIGRVLAPLLALVLLAVLAAGGYKLYRHFQSPDFTGPGTGEVTVQVLSGDTATSLAPRLVKAGVVASTSSFISAAKDSSNPAGLEPGFFRLRHHMNSAIAYALLINPKARIQSVVAVPEGLRETQILTTLEQKTGTSAAAFTKALKDTAALGLPAYANGNPEGFLFPATYNFNPGTSALSMLQTMVARYNQEAASINITAAAKTAQLTPNQVITVASILEAEAGNPKYYADVAEVIYNRLNQGMPLELDSTVNYALHRFGVSLTQSQLQVNSPYNTFIHKGLPPGPIDSPGNAAIEGALHPNHGDLLYFVTVNVKTGLTKFATTAAGFQQLENECNQNNSC
jgi:peptidoglycan lytic transglycosylase G